MSDRLLAVGGEPDRVLLHELGFPTYRDRGLVAVAHHLGVDVAGLQWQFLGRVHIGRRRPVHHFVYHVTKGQQSEDEHQAQSPFLSGASARKASMISALRSVLRLSIRTTSSTRSRTDRTAG